LDPEADAGEPSLGCNNDRRLACWRLLGADASMPHVAYVVTTLVTSKTARALEQHDSHASTDMCEVSIDRTYI
jgi:hypothetical protein